MKKITEEYTDVEFDQNEEAVEELENSEELDYQVSTQGTDWTLEVLSKKINKGDIYIPPFQRKIVWNDVRRSKLIDSFLRGFPVPNIFLFKTDENKLEVIDGQQRLWAVKDFFNDVYPLKKVNKEWDGRKFSELKASDKLKLEDSVIRATIISSITPENPEIIFRIFERLNTGGVRLSDQEIRNGVWGGKLNEVLKKLNLNNDWRSLLGNKKIDSRFQDVEMILRFFALFERWDTYKKPMNEFLTNYLSSNKNNEKTNIQKIFTETMSALVELIGNNAFILEKSINKAFYDAISIGTGLCIEEKKIKKSNIKKNYQKIKDNPEFKKLINEHTTDTKNLIRRIEIAHNILSQ